MGRIHSPSYLKNRKKRQIRWLIALGAIVVAVIGASLWYVHDERFLIKQVTVKGAGFADESNVVNSVQNELSGNYLFFYPKRNAFIYPERTIATHVINTFPSILSVETSLPSWQELHIDIRERTPKALWCGQSRADSTSSTSCFFADDTGFIFNEAPRFSNGVYPVFYSSSTPSPIGTYIVASSTFAALILFGKELSTIGLIANEYDIKGNTCNVYYGTVSHIVIDCDADMDRMFRNLESFISDPRFASSTSTGFDYIDLRLGDKVTFKISPKDTNKKMLKSVSTTPSQKSAIIKP